MVDMETIIAKKEQIEREYSAISSFIGEFRRRRRPSPPGMVDRLRCLDYEMDMVLVELETAFFQKFLTPR